MSGALKHALSQRHLRHFVEVRLGDAFVRVLSTEIVGGSPTRGEPIPAVREHLSSLLSSCSQNEFLRDIVSKRVAADASLTAEDLVTWRELVGGNSNRVFVVSDKYPELKPRIPPLIVREYGVATSSIISRDAELKAAVLLSSKGVAPQVYAVFPEGRVEGFVENSCPATTDELLSKPDLIAEVMRSMRRLHETDASGVEGMSADEPVTIPLIRKLVSLVSQCSREDVCFAAFGSPTGASAATVAAALAHEVEWLERALAQHGGPVVFGHNDANPSNMLTSTPGGAAGGVKVTFIDFEYAGFAPRGFDIGNFLCELDYVYDDKAPGGFTKRFVTAHPDDAAATSLKFGSPVLAMALKSLQRTDEGVQSPASLRRLGMVLDNALRSYHNLASDDPLPPIPPTIVREAHVGMLASHLLWGTWAIVMACTPSPTGSPAEEGTGAFQIGASGLDYVHYAHTRLLEYAELKEMLLADDSEAFAS